MANFYEDNPDLQFNAEHWVDWNAVVPLTERNFADAQKFKETGDTRFEFAPENTEQALESYKAIWDAYAQITDGELTPYLREIDQQGMKYDKGKVIPPAQQEKYINALKESGILVFSIGREYGGQAFGVSARQAITEIVSRADIGTQIIISYYNMSEMIEWYGDQAMKEKYLPMFVRGEMLGAMALTEPNIGSDLTNAATKAVRQEDGSFRLQGTKIFITQGCGFGENTKAAIFTIARSLEKRGAFGLSFFLVESPDIEVSRIEEKIGLHTSATCEIRYDNARGQLIGDEGAGLVKYAINMMNGARIGIACQSVGIAQAALSVARKYAQERIQFGVPIIELPAVRRMIDEAEARVEGARAIVFKAGEFVDRQFGLTQALLDAGEEEKSIRRNPEVQKFDKLAKILTPLSKFTASEFSCKVAYDAVQVHGGVGYTEEYAIAKIFRDARITTIYEGTTQLQTIAVIGSIVEGVNPTSILSEYISSELAQISDATDRNRIQKYWNSLAELTAVYKDQEKQVKEMIALELVWHLSYTVQALFLTRMAEMAAELNHPVLESKSAAKNTMFRLAEAQIAAGEATILSFRQPALV